MKKYLIYFIVLFSASIFAQTSTPTFKKRVLESAEVDFLASYYVQDGSKSSVSNMAFKIDFNCVFSYLLQVITLPSLPMQFFN